MTLSVSAAYASEQANLQRTPIYKAKFANYDIPYATHPIRINLDTILDTSTVSEFVTISETKAYVETAHFPLVNNSPIGDLFGFTAASTLGTSKAYASLFEGQQSQVFPEQGHSSVGSVAFVLTDVNGEVTDLVMSGILGEKVELYAGFDTIDEEDYALFFTGVVGSIRSDNLASYEITVYSPQSLVNRQVFNVAVTTIEVAMTAVATSMTVTGTDVGESQYLQIDDEIISRGVFDPVTGIVPILIRGALGTTAVAHTAGAQVRELIRKGPAHPMEILIDLYQATDKSGCGLPNEYIDWEGITAAIPLIGSAYQMEFRINAPENAMQWAEKEIFQPLGAYPVTKSDGKLSVVVFRSPSSDESVATIDHDSIVHDGERPMLTWELGRDGSLGQITNAVTWFFDVDLNGNFGSSFEVVRQASIDRFGRYPMTIESRGLRTELANTLVLIAARALSILNRYENGSPVVKLTTLLQKELIEPGEVIALTSDLLPNRFTKTRGVTEALVEVVNRNIRFSSGQVDFDLLWTSFADLSRDDFNRADVLWSDDADLNSDGAWLAVAQDTAGIKITGNQLYLGRLGTKLFPAAGGHGAMLRQQEIGPNQSSQLTFKGVLDSGGFSGPAVRASMIVFAGPPTYLETMSGYAAMYETSTNILYLRLYNGTDPTVSTGQELARYPVTLVSGDTVRIEARGSLLRVYVNDVLVIGPIIDTVQTTNLPGALSNYGGTAGGILWDDWVGGDTGWS